VNALSCARRLTLTTAEIHRTRRYRHRDSGTVVVHARDALTGEYGVRG
jgi:hypothetical protein